MSDDPLFDFVARGQRAQAAVDALTGRPNVDVDVSSHVPDDGRAFVLLTIRVHGCDPWCQPLSVADARRLAASLRTMASYVERVIHTRRVP